MGYSHYDGISLTGDGLAVGKKGYEVPIIDSDGKFYFGNLGAGKQYYVVVNAGLDTNDGLSYAKAFKTLTKAITVSNAYIASGAVGWAARNTIYFKGDNDEAHKETLITLPNKCDVVGVGSYDHRPYPVMIGNHLIGAGAYMGTRFINVGFKSLAAGGAIFTIPTTTSGLSFVNCLFDGRTAVPATSAIVATAVEQFTIEGCRFVGKYSAATISIGAGSSRMLLIKNNIIESGAIGVLVNVGMTSADCAALIVNNIIQAVTLVIDDNSKKCIVGGNRCITAAADTLALIIDYETTLAYDNIITDATVTAIYPAFGAAAV